MAEMKDKYRFDLLGGAGHEVEGEDGIFDINDKKYRVKLEYREMKADIGVDQKEPEIIIEKHSSGRWRKCGETERKAVINRAGFELYKKQEPQRI